MSSSTCIIYISVLSEQKEICAEISERFNLKQVSASFFEGDLLGLSITKNDEFDYKAQSQFPDGFLYFKFILEVYFENDALNDLSVNVVSELLEWLWSKKTPAVAACDYEDKLPHNGGYKDSSLPWPKP